MQLRVISVDPLAEMNCVLSSVLCGALISLTKLVESSIITTPNGVVSKQIQGQLSNHLS